MSFKVSRYRYNDIERQFTLPKLPIAYSQKADEDQSQYACGSIGVNKHHGRPMDAGCPLVKFNLIFFHGAIRKLWAYLLKSKEKASD